ncbi:HvfC/BufC family peptide modification chaperone [Aminobacter sp. LjRoot7]|uniref:HvfC/BufC family peptide modification chaperone n=1 Tax=Aminobacter sp. LjRoot7 TaxID=3342335 RepID=UPI003ECDE095
MDQETFTKALLDAGQPVPDGVTSARGEADAARFAVYRNNVAVSLSKALSQRFPVVQRLVGDDFFNGMARAFIATTLPDSPLMFDYGDSFPDFITGFTPAAALPYLADTARLEAQWTRAYHAADVIPLAVGALAAIAPERLGNTTLVPHPAAALVRSNYSIGTIWQAHQGDEVSVQTVMAPENIVITRPDIVVQVHVIAEADAAFATALLRGDRIGEAAAAAFDTNPAFDFGHAMVGLVSLGTFAGFADQ